MKKILFLFIALVCSMSINAQIIKLYKEGQLKYVYGAKQVDEVVVEETPNNFLPGEFSVSNNKKVKFTKSNIYWNGREFKFEEKQTDYMTYWDYNHVSHFYWTKTQEASYASIYNDGPETMIDIPFFAESKGGLTVECTPDLYVLSHDEWNYLINYRTKAKSLRRCYVTVDGISNCMIIAPDGFTGTFKSKYTLDEINTLGLVCLPAAGARYNQVYDSQGDVGYYWASSPYSTTSEAWCIYLNFTESDCIARDRQVGRSIRLVGDVE